MTHPDPLRKGRFLVKTLEINLVNRDGDQVPDRRGYLIVKPGSHTVKQWVPDEPTESFYRTWAEADTAGFAWRSGRHHYCSYEVVEVTDV